MKKIILLATSLILLSSCAEGSRYYRARYNIDLVEVEKNNTVIKQFETAVEEYNYEDEKIRITWHPGLDYFKFKLHNKTDSTMKILWENSLFVDEENYSHLLRDESQMDEGCLTSFSPIIRKGFIKGEIYPCDYFYNKLDIDSLLPEKYFANPSRKIKIQQILEEMYLHKNFQILLSLESKGEIFDYIFVFEINNLNLITP